MGGVRRATPPLCPYYSKEVLFTASESTTNEGVRGVAVANAHNELCVLVNAPASQHVATVTEYEYVEYVEYCTTGEVLLLVIRNVQTT